MKKLLFLALTIISFYNLYGTDIDSAILTYRNCATVMPTIEWENNFQYKMQQYLTNQVNNRTQATYVIPVIVHILFWDDIENISQAQVTSQIDVLNADFAGVGFNSNNVPLAFASLKSNTNISFCLAQKTPNNETLTETGIDRINAQTMGFSNPNSITRWTPDYIENVIKPNTIWDPTRYLNIWVVPCIWNENRQNCNILGYATFPAFTDLTDIISNLGTDTTDGIVIKHNCFGTMGTVTSPYDRGRTTTHEIGHWLGLRHISGDNECGTDYCNDTPTQKGGNNGGVGGLNFGCPTYPFQIDACGTETSPNGEMFMNFMDYTNDACMYMFTTDQRVRMQTTMLTGLYRNPLVNSTTCSLIPVAPEANFLARSTSVCTGNTITFNDLSTGIPTSWFWSFLGGTPATSTAQNPTVTYNTKGSYSVSLTVTNTEGSDVETKIGYINVGTLNGISLPFTEGFQSTNFPPTEWRLVSNSGFNWERTTEAGGFGTSSASMFFNNYYNDVNHASDYIYSPVIDLNGANNPCLKFDVAYAKYQDSSSDTLEILIQEACSNTQTTIYKKGGTSLSTTSNVSTYFIPTSSQWRTDSVFIPMEYLNKNVTIIFKNKGAYGNNFYVDNVSIYNISSCNVTLIADFVSSATSICLGDTIIFTNISTASSGSLDSARWIITGGSPNTSTSTTTIASIFNKAGNYSVSLKAYKCGVVSTSTRSITVNAKPTVSISPGSTSICNGEQIILTASGADNYSWNQTGTILNNTLTFIPTTNPTIVTVNGSVTGCSATGSASSIITVKPNPIVEVNSPTICSGETAQLVATGATTYLWTGGLPAIANPITPILTNNQLYIVVGTINDCSASAVAKVTVNQLPTTPTITQSNDTIYCSVVATNYNWFLGGAYITSTIVPYLVASTSGVYSVRTVDEGCQSNISNSLSFTLTAIKSSQLNVEYSIFPNPNKGVFQIKIISPINSTYKLKMYNVSGQVLLQEDLKVVIGQNTKHFNLSTIEKGIYFIALIGKDSVGIQNIIIQ